jgi:hypothetical protein
VRAKVRFERERVGTNLGRLGMRSKVSEVDSAEQTLSRDEFGRNTEEGRSSSG